MITIIILLILAGVAINLIIGENGIIAKAQQAGKNYLDAQEEEKMLLSNLEFENNIGSSREDLITMTPEQYNKLKQDIIQELRSSQNIYSTEQEQVVGALNDGTPVYQKMFSGDTEPNSEIVVGNIGADSHVIDISCTTRNIDGERWNYYLSGELGSVYGCITIMSDSGDVYFTTKDTDEYLEYTIIVRYTKPANSN